MTSTARETPISARSISIPMTLDAHLQLGHALKMSGDIGSAIDAYQKAVEIDPANRHARMELMGLGLGQLAGGSPAAGATVGITQRAGELPYVALDVSDLLHYFLNARSPTGIQRVQVNVVMSLLAMKDAPYEAILVCFTEKADFWIEVDPKLFTVVCRLSLVSADKYDPAWQKITRELSDELVIRETIRFPDNTTLLNIGTSWWLQNYFLMLRYAKSKYGIKYIPFVHDCIPVIMPEHCVMGLTQDFITWILGVFSHADGFVVNSNATSNDLTRVATLLGYDISLPTVVHLDGRFPSYPLKIIQDDQWAAEIKEKYKIDGDYILFVSTIESRKNHILAFNVWLRLIKQRGLDKVPVLVCVGRNGWMVDAALAKLHASDQLKKKVLILSDISDIELDYLYNNCLFTIYPSSYEGWGLPVTELFCYGKPSLISNVSSLPEAGGRFADYFDPESERDFQTKLEKLIDDVPYRAERSGNITSNFAPREWSAIASDIAAAAASAPASKPRAEPGDANNIWPAPALAGVFHRLSRNTETVIWPGMTSGEVYRMGLGWNFCDDWGCWMKSASADIAFIASPIAKKDVGYLLYLRLQGLPSGTIDTRFAVTVTGRSGEVLEGILLPGQWANFCLKVPAECREEWSCTPPDNVQRRDQSVDGHQRRRPSQRFVGGGGLLLLRGRRPRHAPSGPRSGAVRQDRRPAPTTRSSVTVVAPAASTSYGADCAARAAEVALVVTPTAQIKRNAR